MVSLIKIIRIVQKMNSQDDGVCQSLVFFSGVSSRTLKLVRRKHLRKKKGMSTSTYFIKPEVGYALESCPR